ncbi:MAG: hypothetical protein P1V97_11210 [Planctomycetota bacterium]|nr:hypothetical protein [Planctomycetota bacterium]
MPKLLGLALFLSISFAMDPAFAGDKKKEVEGLIFTMTLLPLALYPIGLAIHLVLASLAPLRSEGLALDLQDHYWKSLLLGLSNSAALFILVGVFSKRAPGLGALCFFIFMLFAFLGLHGIVRSIGEWVLERCFSPSATPTPFKTIAVGWFVYLYVTCIPIAGWFLGCYWIARGIGGVVLQLSGRRKLDDDSLIKIKL